jgi:L-threonylcarbamoyladenylate synthase
MDMTNDIKAGIKTLLGGGTIIYPTDTIWGLGCDATNSAAVEKVFAIKHREKTKSLIVLVDSVAMLERYVAYVPDIAYQLIEVTDSPLTIVYPRGKNLAPGVGAADGSVGIRVCEDPFCSELIRGLRRPIVSTSANFSGAPSPAIFSDIDPKLIATADYVVEYRREDIVRGKASSLIKINSDGTIVVLRK